MNKQKPENSAQYNSIKVENVALLKRPSIYYLLKTLGFSEHHIKTLRNNAKSFWLNGEFVNTRAKICDKDILYVLKNPNKPTEIAPCDGILNILYEDDDYLIVDKPHNLSCTPSRSHFGNNLGGQICKYMWQKDENFVLRIVNRLDRETAGVVIVAKNIEARNNIKNVFKEYYALCEGNFDEKNFTISSPILTLTDNGINQRKRVISKDGKPAITHVTVVENKANYSKIMLILETGRTHQIRVHLSSIGHPLLGDTIYNPNAKENDYAHLLLKKVEFVHFRTNKTISATSKFDL